MNVKFAKEKIEELKAISRQIIEFYDKHEELQEEAGFLCDASSLLTEYREILEDASISL